MKIHNFQLEILIKLRILIAIMIINHQITFESHRNQINGTKEEFSDFKKFLTIVENRVF